MPVYAGTKINCGAVQENCAVIKKSVYYEDVYTIDTDNTLYSQGGGSCKCPNGEIYEVSLKAGKNCSSDDNQPGQACDGGEVLSCQAGISGPWVSRNVVCGSRKEREPGTDDPVIVPGETCYQPTLPNPYKIDNCLQHKNNRKGGGCFQCDNSRGYVLSKFNPEDGVYGVLASCKLIEHEYRAKLQNCWVLKDGDEKKCAMCLPNYVAARDNSACFDPIHSYVTEKIPFDKKKAEYYLNQGETILSASPTDVYTNTSAYDFVRKAQSLDVEKQIDQKSIGRLFNKSKLQLKNFRPKLILIELGYRPGSLDQEKVYMEFVYIKKGSHIMGSQSIPDIKDEFSAHNFPGIPVEIKEGFYFMKYMITREQWSIFVFETNYITDAENQKFLEGPWPGLENSKTKRGAHCNWANPCFRYQQGNKEPVTSISYNDLKKFVEWINKKSNLQLKLPSVAEWEYVAKAGHTTPWGNGADNNDTADELMWNMHNTDQSGESGGNKPNSIYKTMDVGTKDSNDFGVYDMLGNAYEWMEDSYDGRWHNDLKRGRNSMETSKVWSNCKSYDNHICQCYPDWKQPIAQGENCSKERTEHANHMNCLKADTAVYSVINNFLLF